MTFEKMYDILHEDVGASTEALDLLFGISGCNEETACNALYYYTGFNSFESFLKEYEED